MYTGVTPSPPAGVGLNRVDGVKPSVREVNEQAARGEFAQSLSPQPVAATRLEHARAVRELLQNQAVAVANPFRASQWVEMIGKQVQRAEPSPDSDTEDTAAVPAQTPMTKKEKQARQFAEIANFSSKPSLFEFTV